MNENLPTVVIAGRPNVGKSTLFNRLLHKRRSITSPIPGVTRDMVGENCYIDGKPIQLIDTGGYRMDYSPDKTLVSAANENIRLIDSMVKEKTILAIKKGDLIVLLLEAGEITSEDEELISMLRPYKDKMIVAVNKTEGGRREADSWNILSYGFEKVFMISAEHGDNVEDLKEEIINRLNLSHLEEEGTETGPIQQEKRPIRIALLGKPNTGKSTLSNRLCSSNASIVSEIPGTTRDVIQGGFTWKSREFIILDTAGIRRKNKVTENIEYYSVNRAIKTIDDSDIIILMIDAAESLSEQDKKIAALACDKGRGVIFALNKWDTMPCAKDASIKNTFKEVCSRIRFLFGKMEYAPIVALSAKDGSGVDKLLSTVITMNSQLNKLIETSRLNQELSRWLEEHPPPSGPRTRFNVKYAVQNSVNPVSFIFFCSRTQAVSESYISYLRNKIRKDLGFSMIPVNIKIRA